MSFSADEVIWKEFEDALFAAGRRHGTVSNYVTAVRPFVHFCLDKSVPLGAIDEKTIVDYIQARRLSASRISMLSSALRAFVAFTERRGAPKVVVLPNKMGVGDSPAAASGAPPAADPFEEV